MRRSTVGMLVFGLFAFAAVGCSGGTGVPVDGKVVNGGSPYQFAEGEGISINLQGENGKSSGTATVDAKDGSFKVNQIEGNNLPAGKYKVTVTRYAPPAKGGGTAPVAPVAMDGGETWDVSAANHTFTLDMSKYKPAKK